MFKLMDKEINEILGAQTILIWTFVFTLSLQAQQLFPRVSNYKVRTQV